MGEGEKRTGLVQVYTGNGKGKTTAALGLALRAIGHGLTVYMIQFMKGRTNYGELHSAKRLPNLKLEQFGRPSFVDRKKPAKADIEEAEKALRRAKEVIDSDRWDIVILDEINVALDYKLIRVKDVLKLIRSKPHHIELVLTGRKAPKSVISIADLVSEVREVKHPYRTRKLKSRRGIEY
jgi:cob(I)alamin adenosyltransferase